MVTQDRSSICTLESASVGTWRNKWAVRRNVCMSRFRSLDAQPSQWSSNSITCLHNCVPISTSASSPNHHRHSKHFFATQIPLPRTYNSTSYIQCNTVTAIKSTLEKRQVSVNMEQHHRCSILRLQWLRMRLHSDDHRESWRRLPHRNAPLHPIWPQIKTNPSPLPLPVTNKKQATISTSQIFVSSGETKIRMDYSSKGLYWSKRFSPNSTAQQTQCHS